MSKAKFAVELDEPEYGGYPLSSIKAGHFRLEGDHVMGIINDLLAAIPEKNPYYSKLDRAIIPAGDTIHVGGIPFKVVNDTEVAGANIRLICGDK